MSIKLFLLGRPGSGKSTAAKYIEEYAKAQGWKTASFKDHGILYQLFQKDVEQKRFLPEGDGFFVKDTSAFTEALELLEVDIISYIPTSQPNEVITIEFARENYVQVVQQLSQELVEDAYFLCIDTRIDVCIQRVYERATLPNGPDNHFVSKRALQKHYQKQHFPTKKEVKNIWVVANHGSWDEFVNKIDPVLNEILKQK